MDDADAMRAKIKKVETLHDLLNFIEDLIGIRAMGWVVDSRKLAGLRVV